MTKKPIIKNISSLFPILGLALLLLISPCKVRNFIQAELGIPQTQVTNKSKATIGSASCSALESAPSTTLSKVGYMLQLVPIRVPKLPCFSTAIMVGQSVPSLKERRHLVAAIPLYILYQNFKIHL